MHAARTGRREATAELARPFCIAASHESRGLLMPDLNEPDVVLPLSQRLPDAVDAVAGQSEDGIGSASRRVSVCQYVWIWVAAVSLKKQTTQLVSNTE